MTNQVKNDIRKKLTQSRRILRQEVDPDTAESIRNYIEQLEGQMLRAMSEGAPNQKCQV